MKAEINIKVDIGGRPYNLTISRDEEEVVRKAAEDVNKTISKYSKAFEYKDLQDLYAMVSLQYATGTIHIENEKSFKEEEMKDKLKEVDEFLSTHLETINHRS
ncbi:MAG: cell division protein ZapA [Bacteroidales bacterium]|jgi:cell division protein ZapA (FtsZ GTPase activity inhibitor)|nr:cell division protein ZapA [Bacteroidales bacterium]MDG2080683.1 cell division protein ZapA [Bacteroidales bacterium]|tara:strand:+ start:1632 stop:1940 length:309 start_codon:yes stop_codon:yes gene_type:complete